MSNNLSLVGNNMIVPGSRLPPGIPRADLSKPLVQKFINFVRKKIISRVGKSKK